mmetsp:Transcript_19112/g.44995  ORF Transcript_19112/g.44995 Transcript_19112/m.44995 type:complete len:309 (+) Transcript_19112:56-982(+)
MVVRLSVAASCFLVRALPVSCRGHFCDEVGLLQEGLSHVRPHDDGPSQGLLPTKPPDATLLAAMDVGAGMLHWSQQALGMERELRTALLSLNSNNFAQWVEKVCGMAPSVSKWECGRTTSDRLFCPLVFRAAPALVPVRELEAASLTSSENGTMLARWGRTSETSEIWPRAPVTLKACQQQRLLGEMLSLAGRMGSSPAVNMTAASLCGNRHNDSECLFQRSSEVVCRSITAASLGLVGPELLSKQMAGILGTHNIIIGKGRFDIMDDPCKTWRRILLEIVIKFLMGVAAMLVIYCCLITFCCAMWKL